MNNIFKICLALALFITSASVAWAGFNYDSASNYFFIDSLLKSGGNYILVGDAFTESLFKDDGITLNNDFFAVSNNLIIWPATGFFSSSDENETRKMGVDPQGKSFFRTKAITVTSPEQNFQIFATAGPLIIDSASSGQITMNQDFVVDSGLTLSAGVISPTQYNIYADTVLANSLGLLAGEVLLIPQNEKVTIEAGGTATAASIEINGQPFCERKTWNVSDDIANYTAENRAGPDPTIYSCATSDDNSLSCCSDGYYVFWLDVNGDGAIAEMICCRFRS